MKNLINEIEKLDKLASLALELEDISSELKKLSEFVEENPVIKESEFFKSTVKTTGDRLINLVSKWHSIRAA